jgi:aspartate racemase
MKRIGLLGGMSWESTALYYRLLNEGVAERLGGLHSADCVMVSVDFAGIARLQAEGRWDEAGQLLAREARTLQTAGAEVLLLCTNTMHKVADQIQAATDVPLLHIADVTAAAAHKAGLTRVGLLATGFTMEQRFHRDRLESHGLQILVPEAPGRDLVHSVIYQELCRGIFTDSSRAHVRGVIDDLVANGAEGIILGCTEIELLISASDSPVPVLPTTLLHAVAGLDAALGSETDVGA